MLVTPSLGKAYLTHSFVDLNDFFFALDAPFEALQKLLEMQRQ